MKKKAFNKYNPVDLFSQLIHVLDSEPERENGRLDSIVKELRGLSDEIFTELKKPKVQMANKTALYHYDLGNIHRPNKSELSKSMFNCPNCHNLLSNPSTQTIEIVYKCPHCGFEIAREKVLYNQNLIDNHKQVKKDRILDEVCKEPLV